jgi:hypothetical protein
MVTSLFAAALAASIALQSATNQTLTNPNPSDARMNQFDDPRGSSWRVFAVDTLPVGPVAIVQVEELRQHNPPSAWAVSIVNRSFLPVESVTLAAAIVDSRGLVKAIQPLPAIKNLKPSQVQRRQMRVTVTVLAPTDRVVFFIDQAMSETISFKARPGDVSGLIRIAAMRMPLP